MSTSAEESTTVQPTGVRLGKLPVRHDVRTLQLARYVDTAVLPAPPASYDETAHVHDWPMYANDRIGDCTCAASSSTSSRSANRS